MDENNLETRDLIVEDFKALMIGPLLGASEILAENPARIYTTGILFPQRTPGQTYDESMEISQGELLEETLDEKCQLIPSLLFDEKSEDGEGFLKTDSVEMSVFGLSFFVRQPEEVKAVFKYEYYLKEKNRDGKKCYRAAAQTEINLHEYFSQNRADFSSEDGRIRFVINRKEDSGCWLVTIQAANNSSPDRNSGNSRYSERILDYAVFRPEILVHPGKNNLVAISDITGNFKSIFTNDREENMLYSASRLWAKGHNCAVKYNEADCFLQTEFIPDTIIRKLQTELDDRPYLNMRAEFLAGNRSTVVDTMRKFAASYAEWIDLLEIPAEYQKEGLENQRLCRESCNRIMKGIELLAADDLAWKAWQDTNTVMNSIYRQEENISFCYRPFQLGFFLLSLDGLVHPDSNDRLICDLLWIPTGGGKTEAYLAVSCFTILYRRLKYGIEGAGVTVLSRYTLRLLTSQQFLRAAELICRMELLRRMQPENYGREEISLGLLIGSQATPNTVEAAKKLLLKKNTEEYNPFPVESCPACGSKLFNTAETDPRNSFILTGKSQSGFKVKCRNNNCLFSHPAAGLPLHFIDEMIYKSQPSIIIATVDKLAMLPFKTKDYINLFSGRQPPEIVIQDELHLIDSTLGSMYGIYETGFRLFLQKMNASAEHRIKIIASTATPKQSAAQIDILFNRKMKIFPQPAVDINESFFSRLEYGADGRRYVGVYPSGMPVKTAARDVLTALLAATAINRGRLERIRGKQKDKYYLQLSLNDDDNFRLITAYFNSLRELGGISSMIYDDIPKRIPLFLKLLALRHADDCRPELSGMDISGGLYRKRLEKIELTSRVDSSTLKKNLHRLSKTPAADLLFSTNMISVGLDIAALNIMMVNGQPKKTAEYIQSTSRTGRKIPGIVFVLYNPWRIRDTSHYEYFYPYHESFYRYVEPVTVTPFSPRILERALHAQIVTLLRQINSGENQINQSITDFDNISLQLQERIISSMQKMEDFSYDDIKYITGVMQYITGNFRNKFKKVKDETGSYASPFYLYKPDSGTKYLIKQQSKKRYPEAEPTMTSLRDVSADSPLKIQTLEDNYRRTSNRLRSTGYIFTFGPGSIYETENTSVLILGPDFWNIDRTTGEPAGCLKVYDERLAGILNMHMFFAPPELPDEDRNWEFIYARPFPGWMICSNLSCRRLFHYEDYTSTRQQVMKNLNLLYKDPLLWKIPDIFCPFCRDGEAGTLTAKLQKEDEFRLSRCYPFRWIVICPAGHIDEVPVHRFMHPGRNIRRNEHEHQFAASPDDASLSGLSIKCLTCGSAPRSLQIMTGRNNTEWLGECAGNRPWLDTTTPEACSYRTGDLKIVQKGDTMVYFTDTVSSVTIPPWNIAEIIHNIIDKIERNPLSKYREYKKNPETSSLHQKIIDEIKVYCQSDYNIAESAIGEKELQLINEILEKQLSGKEHERHEPDEPFEEWRYRFEEFSAFISPHAPQLTTGFQVRRLPLDTTDTRTAFMQNLVIADLLKITYVQRSFSRVFFSTKNGQRIESRNRNWLPGIQICSEGIFVEFDKNQLQSWSERNRTALTEKYAFPDMNNLSHIYLDDSCEHRAWFYLLHSFSHFLINALSFHCGYNAASLRERIYFSTVPDREMCAVLITTSCGDSEASYGGLAWYGEQKRFLNLISGPICNIETCSNDPLCSEGIPSGSDKNFAACFNCLILPETSCEFRNEYLDRSLLYGNEEQNKISGFFRSFF